MEHPSRQSHESDFAKKLEGLSKRERAELRGLMGWPPDPSKVPASFFDEAAERRQHEAYLVLYFLFLASADHHAEFGERGDTFTDAIDSKATDWAQQRSGLVADRYKERSQAAFDRMAQRIDALRSKRQGGSDDDFPMTKGDFEDELQKVAGPDRDAEAAATNMTAAQTAGGDAAASETFAGGVAANDVWINQPHLTKTGPCERCEALDGKKRKDWGAIEPAAGDGPPLHDYCACIIEYANAGDGI